MFGDRDSSDRDCDSSDRDCDSSDRDLSDRDLSDRELSDHDCQIQVNVIVRFSDRDSSDSSDRDCQIQVIVIVIPMKSREDSYLCPGFINFIQTISQLGCSVTQLFAFLGKQTKLHNTHTTFNCLIFILKSMKCFNSLELPVFPKGI